MVMELIHLKNYVKNGKKTGFYLYIPVVKINNEFFSCESIKSKTILKKNTIDKNLLLPKKLILPEFYQANNIN